MSAKTKAPRVQIEVGDRKQFAIGVILRSLAVAANNGADGQPIRQSDAAKILELTDGYVTFWVGGANVFRIVASTRMPEPLRYYSNVTLSMLLEWIYFDRAYDLAEGASRSFSEVVEGEGTPDLRFHRSGARVSIEWDFRNQTRNGCPYQHPMGRGTIDYLSYLITLSTIADDLMTALENRAKTCGLWDAWRNWLEGYRPEREAFSSFVESALTELAVENRPVPSAH